jgi:hypothetical protein
VAHRVLGVGEGGPGQPGRARAQGGEVGGVRGSVDVLARVDREHREAHREAGVDVARRLQVVGVGARAVGPPLREHPPGRVVHDLGRSPAGPRHLADRLLGEDRGDRGEPADRADRADVARRREAEAVPETRRGAGPERPRAQPLDVPPQPRGVLVGERPDEHGPCGRALRLALEVVEDRGAGRDGDGQLRAAPLADESPLRPALLHARGGDEVQAQIGESCGQAVPPPSLGVCRRGTKLRWTARSGQGGQTGGLTTARRRR